ncbi:MAG: hypothetical protein JNM75_13605 [Rhodospirillales bacterium]|nr:hypothetical protein [Rhodospirillales bacterium]
MHFTNREGLGEWNIPEDHLQRRKLGLSAMVRLKDEETWIGPCLESILPWFDEVVCVLQPCSDRTEQVIRSFNSHKIVIHHYPFDSFPMGPGHDSCPSDSVYSSAYYYNWSLAQTTRATVCKWDGDMVAMDWLGARIRGLMAAGVHRITFHGTDIVGDELRWVSRTPKCPTDGVYPVTPETYYEQGPLSQEIRGIGTGHTIARSAFLHFKWARKPMASAIKQWPEGWEAIPHFRKMLKKRDAARLYSGEYPSAVLPLVTLVPA